MSDNFKISVEEAKKMLLQVPFDDDADDEIFDIYGNYVYPFDIKIEQPNTAVGFTSSVVFY